MPSGAADVDRGQLVGRRLSHVVFVMDLHELSPVGRWATGGRDGRRHEIGQPVQEVTRREFDDAVSARPRGLLPAPRADPAAAEANGPLDLTQEAVDAAAAPIPSIPSP